MISTATPGKEALTRRRRFSPLAFLLLASLASLGEVVTTREDVTATAGMKAYTPRFDDASSRRSVSDERRISDSVETVQRVAVLEVAGQRHQATGRPRCGVPDYDPANSGRRLQRGRGKRYTHYRADRHPVKWDKKELTWSLTRSTSKVDRGSVISDIERAFRLWSDASSLRFRRLEGGKVDIEISFVRGEHGDGHPFYAQDQRVAHAFPPQDGDHGGDVHMNDEHNWMAHELAKKSTGPVASIFLVAAHELGHSLGLDHSDDPKALMFHALKGVPDCDVLPDDDTRGIQLLYGPPPRPDAPRTPSGPVTYRPPSGPVMPRPPSGPVMPRSPSGPVMPRPPSGPVMPRSPSGPVMPRPPSGPVTSRPPPRPVTSRPPPRPDAPRLPSGPVTSRPASRPVTSRPASRPVTSRPASRPVTPRPPPPDVDFCNVAFDVVTSIRGVLFFFKNEFMWHAINSSLVLGPKHTAEIWRGLPVDLRRVDAVYEEFSTDHVIKFFIGDKYYSFYDWNTPSSLGRSLSTLRLPSDVTRVDSALGWNDRYSYLFSDNRYWQLDEAARQVVWARDAASDWRGVPLPPSSSFRWTDGKTYFFQGKLFWEFGEQQKSVTHPTGRLVSSFWQGCPRRSTKDTGGGGGRGHDADKEQPTSGSTTVTSPPDGGGVFFLLLLVATVLFFGP